MLGTVVHLVQMYIVVHFFKTPPKLPHGPSGIFVGHDVKIGSNCTIFHQVTIAHGGA